MNQNNKKNINPISITELRKKNIVELHSQLANPSADQMDRQSIIYSILFKEKNPIIGEGIVVCLTNGTSYIRPMYLSSKLDIVVPQELIRKYKIKSGHWIECVITFNGDRLCTSEILTVNGTEVSHLRSSIDFDARVPDYPRKRIILETPSRNSDLSMRLIDLMVPLGFGHRALITAPPKCGKTVLMQNIAKSIELNHPEALLLILLIDERPEEVTDMSRSIKSEVISSSFDQDPMEHIKVAEITLSRAKRAAEDGRDVVILLDSLTRLTRAYNTTSPSSGRILTGGIDSNALQKPKKFFGAARSLEGSGSITIIASMLVETGSKMDDVIFEELHGRGNWNLELNRRLSELGLFPAVNLSGSGVRRCELLPDFNHQLYMTVRKYLASKTPSEALTLLLQKIKSTTNNNQLLSLLNGSQG